MKKIDIIRYEFKDKKIDKNIKIMFLSDLHNRDIINELLSIINNENPDIIIMGGDMVNQDLNDTENYYKLCKKLTGRTVYYVLGNHEFRFEDDDLHKYMERITNYNVEIINNHSVKLSKNIALHGFSSDIDCYKKFYRRGLTSEYIKEVMGEFDKNKYNILIAHNPLEFESYKGTNSDLVLTGHVHGGLIDLPLVGGLFSPDYTLFPKYYKGTYNYKNMTMIVSRGLGLSKRIPIRLFNNPEVVIINLIKND